MGTNEIVFMALYLCLLLSAIKMAKITENIGLKNSFKFERKLLIIKNLKL